MPRVPIAPANAGDELDQLAASFNEMANSLEQAERRRLELVGNVAHELRTPISTLEGYLEGLLDGVVDHGYRDRARIANPHVVREVGRDWQDLCGSGLDQTRAQQLTLRPSTRFALRAA